MTIPVSDLIEGMGITNTLSAVASSDTMANSPGRSVLVVNNGSGGQITVTITAQDTTTKKPGYGNLQKPNCVHTIATGAVNMIGPFSRAYNNSSGNLAVGFSATGTVTARGYNLPIDSANIG